MAFTVDFDVVTAQTNINTLVSSVEKIAAEASKASIALQRVGAATLKSDLKKLSETASLVSTKFGDMTVNLARYESQSKKLKTQIESQQKRLHELVTKTKDYTAAVKESVKGESTKKKLSEKLSESLAENTLRLNLLTKAVNTEAAAEYRKNLITLSLIKTHEKLVTMRADMVGKTKLLTKENQLLTSAMGQEMLAQQRLNAELKSAIPIAVQYASSIKKLGEENKFLQSSEGAVYLAATKLNSELKNSTKVADDYAKKLVKLREEHKVLQSDLGRNVIKQERLNAEIKNAVPIAEQYAQKLAKLREEHIVLKSEVGQNVLKQERLNKGLKESTSIAEQYAQKLIKLREEHTVLKSVVGQNVIKQEKLNATLKNSTTVTEQYEKELIKLKQEFTVLNSKLGQSVVAQRKLNSALKANEKHVETNTQKTKRLREELVFLQSAQGKVYLETKKAIAAIKGEAQAMDIARQSTTAFRASLMAAGASIGIYTSSTIVAGAGAYALVRAFRSVISVGIEFEKTMHEVQAIMGLTEQSMIGNSKAIPTLEEEVKRLGRTTRFTATEVAGGLAELARAGVKGADALNTLEPSLRLAVIGQISMARSSDLLTNIIYAFGLVTADASDVVDRLAFAVSNSNATIEQMANALSYVAPIARATGIEMTEVVATLQEFHNIGLKSSRAGTSMRRALVNMLSPSRKASDALQRLGVTTKDVNGEMRPLIDIMEDLAEANANMADVKDFFGVRAAAAMGSYLETLKDGTNLIRYNEQALKDSQGTSEDYLAIMKKTTDFANREFAAALEGKLNETFLHLNNSLVGLIKSSKDWLNELDVTAVGEAADSMVKFTHKVAENGETIGKVVGALVLYKLGIKSATAATWAFVASNRGSVVGMTAMNAQIALSALSLANLKVAALAATRAILPLAIAYAAFEGISYLIGNNTKATKNSTKHVDLETAAVKKLVAEYKKLGNYRGNSDDQSLQIQALAAIDRADKQAQAAIQAQSREQQAADGGRVGDKTDRKFSTRLFNSKLVAEAIEREKLKIMADLKQAKADIRHQAEKAESLVNIKYSSSYANLNTKERKADKDAIRAKQAQDFLDLETEYWEKIKMANRALEERAEINKKIATDQKHYRFTGFKPEGDARNLAAEAAQGRLNTEVKQALAEATAKATYESEKAGIAYRKNIGLMTQEQATEQLLIASRKKTNEQLSVKEALLNEVNERLGDIKDPHENDSFTKLQEDARDLEIEIGKLKIAGEKTDEILKFKGAEAGLRKLGIIGSGTLVEKMKTRNAALLHNNELARVEQALMRQGVVITAGSISATDADTLSRAKNAIAMNSQAIAEINRLSQGKKLSDQDLAAITRIQLNTANLKTNIKTMKDALGAKKELAASDELANKYNSGFALTAGQQAEQDYREKMKWLEQYRLGVENNNSLIKLSEQDLAQARAEAGRALFVAQNAEVSKFAEDSKNTMAGAAASWMSGDKDWADSMDAQGNRVKGARTEMYKGISDAATKALADIIKKYVLEQLFDSKTTAVKVTGIATVSGARIVADQAESASTLAKAATAKTAGAGVAAAGIAEAGLLTTAWSAAAFNASVATLGGAVGIGLTAYLAGLATATAASIAAGFIQNTVSGKRARGGPVYAGQSYIVGDGGGDEVFTPERSGYITPHNKTPSRGGSGGGTYITQHVTIDATGNEDIEGKIEHGMSQATQAAYNMVYQDIVVDKGPIRDNI